MLSAIEFYLLVINKYEFNDTNECTYSNVFSVQSLFVTFFESLRESKSEVAKQAFNKLAYCYGC